jgi:hypothetical protein
VRSQPGKIFCHILSRKKPLKKKKKRAGGMAQGEGSEFKPQYCKTKQKKPNPITKVYLVTIDPIT